MVFPAIFNVKRSGLPVNAGYMDFNRPDAGEHFKYLNSMQREVPNLLGDDVRLDFLTFEYAKVYLKQYQPKVMYISFGETDDFAHQGNYELYLKQAHATDGFIKQLWDYIQSNPQYKDKTTLLITCDHGRGDVPLENWKDHGQSTPHSEQTWFAVIGPDTPPIGVVKTPTTTYHKQLAQTMAKLLGFDIKANAGHEVGDAVPSVTGK
jgi:phosphopentomutase